MGISRAIAVPLGATLVLVASPARAFDYVEHARITQAGIDLFLGFGISAEGAPPKAHACAELSAEKVKDCESQRDWLDRARVELGSSHICPKDSFLAYAPAGCFAVSDIPALAGDNSANVMTLKWRWFNDALRPQDQRSGFAVGLSLVAGLARKDHGPDTTALGPPEVSGFLQYVRRHQSRSWPTVPSCREGDWDPTKGQANLAACAADDTAVSDFDFMRYDSDYGTLSERGRPHFRPATCAWSSRPNASEPAFFEAPRYSDTAPGLNAFAWYADYHVGAAALQAYARTIAACRPDESNAWLGAAVVLELYALHFIEDAVASGHMQANAEEATNAQLNAIHGAANLDGVVVRCPNLDQLDPHNSLKALRDACSAGERTTRVHGDHFLVRQGLANPGARVTFEWAAALVERSLRNLYEAPSDGDLGSKFSHLSTADRGRTVVDIGDDVSREECSNLGLRARRIGLSDPTALNGFRADAADLPGYRRLAAWGVDHARDHRAILKARRTALLEPVMQFLPMPESGTSSDTCTAYDGANRRMLQKDFGGLFFEPAVGVTYHFESSAPGARLRFGPGIAVPPRIFPAQLQAGLQWDTSVSTDASPRADRHGAQIYVDYRQFFAVEMGFFLEGQAGAGLRIPTKSSGGGVEPRATWALGGGYLWRSPHRQVGFQLLTGFDPAGGFAPSAAFVYSEVPH